MALPYLRNRVGSHILGTDYHIIKKRGYATISKYHHGFYKRPSSDGEGLQVA